MKNPLLKPVLWGAAALGMCAFVTSCVEPDYAYGRPHGGGGRVIHELPRGYREESFGGSRYYRHGDVYYRQQGGGYVVVDSPHRGPEPIRRGPEPSFRAPDTVRRGQDSRYGSREPSRSVTRDFSPQSNQGGHAGRDFNGNQPVKSAPKDEHKHHDKDHDKDRDHDH